MLTCRKGIYYYRRAIPESLRAEVGKRELVVSLRTRDKTEALLKAHYAAKKYQKLIDEALIGTSMAEFNIFKKSHLKTETRPDGTVITTSEKTIDPDTILALSQAGVPADQIALIIRKFLEDQGHISTPEGHIKSNLDEMRSSVTIKDYVKQYVIEYERKQNEVLNLHKKIHLRRLTEIFPDDKKIMDVTQLDAAEVRDKIAKLPKNPKAFTGLQVLEVLNAAKVKDPEYKKITATNVNRHFETYIQLFNQAKKNELYMSDNPFAEIEIIEGGSRAKRLERNRIKEASKTPYSNEDLIKIFGSDLYLRYGENSFDEGIKFWMPLIGLLTGSRMSQITSLYCDDITIDEKSGIPIIDFNEKTDDKRGKTDASFRPVPMHPLLIKLGLIEFANKVRSYNLPSNFGGGPRLFPELKSFNSGSYSGRVEEWYNRELSIDLEIRSIGDTKSFHSYRSTLVQLLKEAGADEFKRNCIIGWKVNTEKENEVVRTHYSAETMESLLKSLSAINLPKILYQIPAFPFDLEMNFKRKYLNQWQVNNKRR